MKLVIQSGSRVWGGVERWFATVAVGLRARGHEVIVSCRESGPVRERLESLGVPTTAARPKGDVDALAAWRFARWLRRERPDALLLINWRRTFWGAWAGRRAGVPRVLVRLGIFHRPRPFDLNRLALRGRVDDVITNSREIRDAFVRAYPAFPPGRVHVIFNGIEPFAPRPGFRERVRAEVGAGPGTLLLAAVGHAFPRKGFDVLVRAFAAAAIPDARLAIVGGGEQLPELRALAASLGVADRVHLLGPRPDAAEVTASSDLFVLSSRQEGMANVMLEAMAAGVPIVATGVSGVREALGEGDGRPAAGWIVPPGEPAALAAALAEAAAALRTDPARVEARRAEASRRVERWFSMDRMLDRVERACFGPAGALPEHDPS